MKTAEPICHFDEYNAPTEREISGYFREVIFGPLLATVRDFGVKPKVSDQGRSNGMDGLNDWTPFPESFDSLKIPRVEMPQFAAVERSNLREYLSRRGVQSRELTCIPRMVKPTQAEFSPSKVQKAREWHSVERAILIASDWHILDGHHQWMAALDDGRRINVVQFAVPIKTLIEQCEGFHESGIGSRNNSKEHEAIAAALASGRIWYADGLFYGQFNARIVAELREAGASFNRNRKGYALTLQEMPFALRGALSESAAASKELHADILRQINTMAQNVPQAPTGIPFDRVTDRVFDSLDEQFAETTEKYEAIPQGELLNTAMRDGIRREFTENLDLAIKNFLYAEIPILRAEVQKNAFSGGRTDRLARIIEARFGVAKRKAAFLADQETGLLTAKYRQQRYEQVGITAYVWSTSHDERVRPDHAALNGMVFSFDDPPITNRTTGARNNPGEDFRCRCVARPILPGQSSVRHKPSVSRV